MHIYIAGPMSGHQDWNFPAFNAAEAALRAMGHNPVNPVKLHPPPTEDPETDWLHPLHRQRWRNYLGVDLHAIMGCDSVALLPGWAGSRGAFLEALVAAYAGLQLFAVAWRGAELLLEPAAMDAEVAGLATMCARTLVGVVGANSVKHGGHVEWQARSPQFHLQKVARHAVTAMANLDMHEAPRDGEGAREHVERVVVRGAMALARLDQLG